MKTSSTFFTYFKNIKGLICLFIAICYGLDGMSQSIPFPSNPLINLGTFHSNNDSSQRYILNTNAFLANMTATDTLDSVFKVYINNQLLDSLTPMKRLPVEIPKSLLHAGNNDIQIDMMLGNNLNILAQTQQFSLFVCEPYTLSLTSSPTSPVAIGTPVTITANLGLSSNMGTQFTYNWSSNNSTTLTPSTSVNNNVSVATNLMPSFNSISVTIIDENGCTGVGNIVIEVSCNANGRDIENYEYSNESTISNGVFLAKQDIIVKNGATLNIRNATIYFHPCTRLIVERGARLIVDDSKLTTCGNFTWLGIEAHGLKFSDRDVVNNLKFGSSYVRLNRTRIFMAEIGVLAGKRDFNANVYDQNYGGAILNISYSIFNNNKCHLALTQFEYDNHSFLNNNQFLDLFPISNPNINNCFIENIANDQINIGYGIPTNYVNPTIPPHLITNPQPYFLNSTGIKKQMIYICGNKNVNFYKNKYENYSFPSDPSSPNIRPTLGIFNLLNSRDIVIDEEEATGFYEIFSSVKKCSNIYVKNSILFNGSPINYGVFCEIDLNNCDRIYILRNKFYNNLSIAPITNQSTPHYCSYIVTDYSKTIEINYNEFKGSGDIDFITSRNSGEVDIKENEFATNSLFNPKHHNTIYLLNNENVNIEYNNFNSNVDYSFVNVVGGKKVSFKGNVSLSFNSVGYNAINVTLADDITISGNQVNLNGISRNRAVINVFSSSNLTLELNEISGKDFLCGIRLEKVEKFNILNNVLNVECETGIFILKSTGTGNSVTPYSRLTSNSIISGRMQNGIHISNSKDVFLSRTSIDIVNPLRFDQEQLFYYGLSPLMTTGFGIQITNQSENVVIQNSPIIKSSHCGVGYFNGIPTRNDNWLDHNIINECDYGLLISYLTDPTMFTFPTQQTGKHRLKTFCNTFNTRIADIIGYGNWVDQGSTAVNAGNTFSITPLHPNISWFNTTSSTFTYYGFAIQHSGSFEVHKQSSIFSLPLAYAEYGTVNNSFIAFNPGPEDCSDISIKPSYYRALNSTSTNDKISDIDLKLFPNPTKNLVEINSQMLLHNVTVMDVYGKIYKELIRVNKQHLQIDLSDLSNGIYFVKISDVNDQIRIEKIVKNE